MTESLADQIQEQNNLLKKEIDKWQQLGVAPHDVVEINTLMLDTYVNGLAAFLVEKGVIEDEELTLFFKKRMLERLQKHREEVTPMIQEQRRRSLGIETAMAIPKNLKLN